MIPFHQVGNARFLNVPHMTDVLHEIVDQDCYRLESIPDGSIVIDVGAFYGEFGLLCHKNKGCFVMAYEPAWENFLVAQLNYTLNTGIDHRCQLSHSAIAGERGNRVIYYRPDHPAGCLIDSQVGGVPEEVTAITMLSAIHLALRRSYGSQTVVVKMDCEGSEVEIFKGDMKWLELTDIVTMEWHNHDGDVYAAILGNHGFNVELEGGGEKPRPKWDKSIGGGLLFATKRK